MNLSDVEKSAVDELLRLDDPEGYCETLSLLFESWITTEASNGATPEQRSQVLTRFKSLRKFLLRIRKKQKLNMKRKENLVWIS